MSLLSLEITEGWKLWANLQAADSITSEVERRYGAGLPENVKRDLRQCSIDCRKAARELHARLRSEER